MMIMALNKYFVKQGIKEVSIDNFIRQNFPSTDYSDIELQRTPLGIKIVINTHKPGRVIGRSGSTINRMGELLKKKFDLDNPQLDVKSIANPNLDSKTVAKQIKTALERGYNYKKIGNVSLKKVMDAGAIGVEIVISGKLGGSKGRVGKFIGGYIKHCGNTAEELVDYGFEEANTKPGKIGIKVKIMKELQDITGEKVTKIIRRSAPEKKSSEGYDTVDAEGSLDFDYSEDEPPTDEAEEKPEKVEAESEPKQEVQQRTEGTEKDKAAGKKPKAGDKKIKKEEAKE
ncbi:MAG: 30S ribosomal protein S3 [Candidatus Aenigmarchaeota archaeon]|nr:30S ribosomal protein S3 [Candidatus Aenigmarchaeota archaeon]